MDQALINRFKEDMFQIYNRAKKDAGYSATRYLQMLSELGEIQTAHILINSDTVSEGYIALWERGRLDLTVEALVVENSEYHRLFSKDELVKARKRLLAYNYSFKN